MLVIEGRDPVKINMRPSWSIDRIGFASSHDTSVRSQSSGAPMSMRAVCAVGCSSLASPCNQRPTTDTGSAANPRPSLPLSLSLTYLSCVLRACGAHTPSWSTTTNHNQEGKLHARAQRTAARAPSKKNRARDHAARGSESERGRASSLLAPSLASFASGWTRAAKARLPPGTIR